MNVREKLTVGRRLHRDKNDRTWIMKAWRFWLQDVEP